MSTQGLEMNWLLLMLIPLTLLAIVIGLVIYLLPTMVAFKRDHPHKLVITLLNVLLGGTLVVWIACLIWAFSDMKASVPARQE